MKIQIRFDGPPGPNPGRFVEVENEEGESLTVGEWKQEGPWWLLVIDTDEVLTQRQIDNVMRTR